jgi:carboxyl-terminal processing protease
LRSGLWHRLFPSRASSWAGRFFIGATLGVLILILVSGGTLLYRSGFFTWIGPVLQASNLVEHSYVEPVEPEKIKRGLLAGLASGLDPHSTYLPPEEFSDMMKDMAGNYGGIGAVPRKRREGGEDRIIITDLMPGGPGDKAGMKVKDEIIAVEGESIVGKSLSDVVSKIRGPMGSAVRLGLRREGKSIEVSVIRDEITVPSVQSALVDSPEGGKVLVLRLRRFGEPSVREMAQSIIEAFHGSERPVALVIDLRDNPGGILRTAVGVAAFFLPPDAVVTESRGRDPNERLTYRARRQDWIERTATNPVDWVAEVRRQVPEIADLPLALLVNRGSASASEVVAAALKDQGRALIVGSRTFGKGSVQTLFHLGEDGREGAIKLTTSRYYSPKGTPIQAVGVEPDIKVADRRNGVREADLPNHLKSAGGREFRSEDEEKEKESTPPHSEAEGADAREGSSPFSRQFRVESDDAHVNRALEALAKMPRPAKAVPQAMM